LQDLGFSDVAHLAAGGLLSLTQKVVNEELDNGFAVIRPPGSPFSRNKTIYVQVIIVRNLLRWDSAFSTMLQLLPNALLKQ
jgi:hypothetical protein